jgi:molybdopterin-guanine dinucleotide biosynthesis protein B
MDIVAVIGAGQNSGKTTAVVALVSEVSQRGLRVGTIKQIHERNFSIDKRGKDTWRHTEAGAKIVIAASPVEIASIKRIDDDNRYLESMKILEGQDLDLVIVEGHPGVNVPMIYAAKDENIVKEKPIDPNVLCIVSLSPENFNKKGGLPVYHAVEESSRIADLIFEKLNR